jgi:hypothetical protein
VTSVEANPTYHATPNTDAIEITPAMIEAGVAALEARMLEGQILESEKALAIRDVFWAMNRQAMHHMLPLS